MKEAGKTESLTAPAVDYSVVFRGAVEVVLRNEGGLSDDDDDAGGLTKFGISQRQYPALDIRKLTREAAIAIYYHDWWTRFNYQQLPAPIGAKLFDLAVNIGHEAATRCLQRGLRACGVDRGEDGVLGANTRYAIQATPTVALLAALRAEAAGHYRLLAQSRYRDQGRSADKFLKGWLRRAYQ